jgi:hypothetical protein
MRKIDSFSTIEGRKLLYHIFYEIRYEKQQTGFATLALLWRICTREREIFKFVNQDVTIAHPLGFFSGTALWMEEILNRYYFSTINSFVYLGAALLLILIGIRRFSDNISDNLVIAGVAFEAMMLIFMFIVMLFTPHEEITESNEVKEQQQGSIDDLIIEVGEIGRDFAVAVSRLEKISDIAQELIKSQKDLLRSVGEISKSASEASQPNPEMIHIMKDTNEILREFKLTVGDLNNSAGALRKELIEFSVRKEVERLISEKISGNPPQIISNKLD